MQEQVSTKRVNNDFGFFIPEVLLKIVCNKINFILEAILLEITSSFTPYYFVATIMYAPSKTSVKASAHQADNKPCLSLGHYPLLYPTAKL